MDKNTHTINEVAKQLKISRHTLGRLCNSGLIPHIRRNRQGYRVLSPEQVDFANILLNMKQAGFTKRELRRYSRLYRQGARTAPERLAMLTTRKRQLWQEISQRQKAIDFIERQEEIAGLENPSAGSDV